MHLEMLLHIKARLLAKGTNEPLGKENTVRVYDKDLYDDDYLGEATPNEDGTVEVTFAPKDIQSWDSPLEEKPDVYFVVMRGKDVLYKSPVFEDLDPDTEGNFIFEHGMVFDLGTFLVDIY